MLRPGRRFPEALDGLLREHGQHLVSVFARLPPFDEMRKMRGGMLKVLAETWDEYMRTLNGALDLKRTARDGMNIEEPGLDTYKVGTVEAPSGGDVNMHTIEGQVAVITGAAGEGQRGTAQNDAKLRAVWDVFAEGVS